MIKSNNIILILTKEITEKNLIFFEKFKELYNINFFFITDIKSKNKNTIFIKNSDCLRYNIKNFTHTIYKSITAWDRGIAFLSHYLLDNFNYAWIIEDDVLIKSTECLYNLILKYDEEKYDIITNHVSKKENNLKWQNWDLLKNQNLKLEYRSFNCFCRISKEFINKLRSHVLKNFDENSFFHEILFINLCIENKMKIKIFEPEDKMLIRWRPEIQLKELKKNYFFYHPVKDHKLKNYFIKYL